MPADLAHQLDVAARLLVAALLGAAIGFEREIHSHPAGMRTHLLVALGSALFTVISIFGFVGGLGSGVGAPVDPSRVAAQIVTGIGFLGAGAILKFGTSVRGLTTAASLWATSAVGMGVGAGQYVLALVGTGIVVVSLWPLQWVEDRIHGPEAGVVHLRVELHGLESIARISDAARDHRLDIVSIETQRLAKNRYEVDLRLRVRTSSSLESFTQVLGTLGSVEVLEAGAGRAE
jgi:putative Mg2+ transporter-C (MgtC) family protein